MITPLAGPAYTPEMGFTIAGSILISHKTNPRDNLIQRSSTPIGYGVSSAGAIFFSSIVSTFWLEDQLRIYADIWYKDMPDHYWGTGSISRDPYHFRDWLPKYGFGYRLEMLPRMNLRIDIGIGRETAGFYFNFAEAF